MRAILWGALIAAVVVLTLALQTAQGSRGFSALIRAPVPGLADRVAEFAKSHDWRRELERHGVDLERGDREQLFQFFQEGEVSTDGRRVAYQLRYSLTPPVSPRRHRAFHGAAELMEARLQLEADLEVFPHLSDVERRWSIAWRAFGSGFDERVEEFLRAAAANDPDPKLRAELRGLLALLEE